MSWLARLWRVLWTEKAETVSVAWLQEQRAAEEGKEIVMRVFLMGLVWGVAILWTIRQRHRARHVSDRWLETHTLQATKDGWDGPRWRLPKERA